MRRACRHGGSAAVAGSHAGCCTYDWLHMVSTVLGLSEGRSMLVTVHSGVHMPSGLGIGELPSYPRAFEWADLIHAWVAYQSLDTIL